MNNSILVLLALVSLGGCNHNADLSDSYNLYKQARANEKVDLCHFPPGNPGNAHTINISVNAVDSHLNNHEGDHAGECTCEDFNTCDTGPTDTGDTDTGPTDTGDTDTGDTDTGDTDTTPTDTGETDTDTDTDSDADTDTDSDTDSDSDADTDSDSDADSDYDSDTDTDDVTRVADEVWVQGGSCNTTAAPIGIAGLLSGLFVLFARRKEEC